MNDNVNHTELGDLPAEWEVVQLGDVAKVRGGNAFPHRYQGYTQGEYPFYKVSDMNLVGNEFYMKTANNYVDDEIISNLSSKTFPLNTIIFPKVGAALHTNKKRILTREALVDNNVMGVTVEEPDKRCFALFLLYWFHSIDLTKFSNPGPLPSITGQVIKEAKIPLPPLDEQRKIARVLNSVQQAIATQADLIVAAKELKRSLLRRLFTYGPGPDLASTKETAIGEVPVHWYQTTVGTACDTGGGSVQTGPFGSQLHASDYVNSGIPSVMPKNIGKDGKIYTTDIALISKEDHKRLSRYHVQEGDIVYGRRGDIGRRALVLPEQNGWLCGTGCLRIRIGKLPIAPEYLSYYLGYKPVVEWIISQAIGTTMLNLNSTILRSVPLYYPEKCEQHQIVHILQSADAKIAAEQDRRAALQALFNSLLQELMTGRLRVNNLIKIPLS